ncbi:right-handed parallel beta-helix repeat-containing protein [Allosphingosinicella sp.]|uniref:right-handed parallel beta-helix repeat-containing protein n=1 Tax=Allosphingosinicella sp. TaxID=2823234 RepID=UPI002EF89F1F
MDRRDFLLGLLTATALARTAAAAAQAPAGSIDVVQRFGFVGDGRTDNYEAFHRFADHANRVRGGSYVFPPGRYFVGRWRTEPQGTRDRRHVVNSELVDCDGLTISGYGAKILLNGRFHRAARRGRDGLTIGVHTSTFMPFEIRRCRNLTIQGLEIDGGVGSMSRDSAVPEGYSHLIALSACSNVLLKDLDLHHGQVDGLYLSDDVTLSNIRPGRACRNVRLQNVKCRNNGRGGFAVLQVWGLVATDCEFSGNGFPGGRYAYHMPGFGVDIEPDRSTEGVEIDTKTGNLEFRRCTFNDNWSAIIAGYAGNYKGYCRFIDCNSRNREGPHHIIASWPGEGMLIQGGTHDAGPGCIHLSWQAPGSRTVLRDMRIRSSHIFGFLHGAEGSITDVQGCELTGTHRTAESGHFPFLGQDPGRGRKNVFKRNRIFIPAARKDRSAPFDIEPNFHNTELEGNEYSTDLAVPGHYFMPNYAPTCTVRNERFRGRFPGVRDTFRPVGNEAHDTRLPYSR